MLLVDVHAVFHCTSEMPMYTVHSIIGFILGHILCPGSIAFVLGGECIHEAFDVARSEGFQLDP